MRVVKGDLVKMACAGEFDVIVHGCNCFCTMGAGIAKSIKSIFPEAYLRDLETPVGSTEKLGTISWAPINRDGLDLIVVNGYTQYKFGKHGVHVDYKAVQSVMNHVRKEFGGRRIGYPKIGGGLGGGDWNIISEIIDETLKDEDHTLVEWSDN